MESVEEKTSSASFINHVFNFDDESKSEILNIIQYSGLSIIPVIFLNKSIQKYIPEADEDKGSLEILAEILVQIIIMFVGILFIHRIITFIPTYSNEKYAKLHVTNIILAFMVIVLSLQTKLGEKVNILIDRGLDLVDGKTSLKQQKQESPVQQPTPPPPQLAPQSLPPVRQQQPTPNLQGIYQGPSTPLVDTNVPIESNTFEPMAANETMGGGFGSAF